MFGLPFGLGNKRESANISCRGSQRNKATRGKTLAVEILEPRQMLSTFTWQGLTSAGCHCWLVQQC